MYTDIKRVVESEGAFAAQYKLMKLFEEAKTTLDNKGELISIRKLFESVVGPVDIISHSNRGGFIVNSKIQEADVRRSAFSNLMGVLLSNTTIAAYESYNKLKDELTTLYPSNELDERLPGFIAAEDLQDVEEGEEYPDAGMGDKYVTTGEEKKKGRTIFITDETIKFDKTNKVMMRAKDIGKRAAEVQDENVIACVTGSKNCYYPAGVETALYGAAPYLVASNALVDYTDIENVLVSGFGAMTDEKNKNINSLPKNPICLVPLALYFTALQIFGADKISLGDYDATTPKQHTFNPVQGLARVRTSPLIQTYNGNSTTWHYGDFANQFMWKEIYPIQTYVLSSDSLLKFKKDIIFGYKVRYRGWTFARDQKSVVKSTA